jgi:hypothetical protein
MIALRISYHCAASVVRAFAAAFVFPVVGFFVVMIILSFPDKGYWFL